MASNHDDVVRTIFFSGKEKSRDHHPPAEVGDRRVR
jgi:hypothetical protein